MQNSVENIFEEDALGDGFPQLRPVQAFTLVDRVRTLLEEAIVTGRFRPGERLLEANLSARLKVSRTPIREALRQLEREGLVDAIPRRGFFVRPMSVENIEEVLLIRSGLLPLAVRLATQHAKKTDLAHCRACIDQMEGRAEKDDVRGFLRHNQELITRLLQLSRRPQLIRMVESLDKQVLRYRFLSLSLPGRMKNLAKGMRSVVAALGRGDGTRAQTIFRELIEQNIENVKRPEFQKILEHPERIQPFPRDMGFFGHE